MKDTQKVGSAGLVDGCGVDFSGGGVAGRAAGRRVLGGRFGVLGAAVMSAVGVVCVCGLMVGCDEQGGGGGGSAAGGGGAGGGGPLGGLVDQPQSVLGRSAAAGRSAGEQISASQDRVGRQADAMSGQGGRTVTAGGLSWTAPEGWEIRQPTSRMRAAELAVGRTSCAFFHFPRGGGGVQENIDRWAGQFRDESGRTPEPRVSRLTINGRAVHHVELSGTFTDAMSGITTPQRDWAMRGAIIEGPDGSVMLKWVGPREDIESRVRAWRAMLDGMGNA